MFFSIDTPKWNIQIIGISFLKEKTVRLVRKRIHPQPQASYPAIPGVPQQAR